jgi:tight adherence protein B
MLTILVLAIFITVAVGAFVLVTLLDQRSEQGRTIRERLQSVDQAAQRGPSEELALLRDDLLSGIPALNRLLAKSQRISRLQRLLSQADIKLRAGKFLLITACSGAFAWLMATVVIRQLLFSVPFAVAGVAIPFVFVVSRRSKRFHKFEEIFPQAMDFLARAVRAGHAFPTALEMITTEIPEPVAGEFRILFEEQKFGLPIRDALLNLAERVPLIDVKFFVTTVVLQRETGGNLAEILDKLSYVMRERFKILRQVKTFTAQGRMSMMLLMALPPGLVLLLSVMNPEFIRPLYKEPIGHLMIAVGATMQFIGYLLIRKIIQIKV